MITKFKLFEKYSAIIDNNLYHEDDYIIYYTSFKDLRIMKISVITTDFDDIHALVCRIIKTTEGDDYIDMQVTLEQNYIKDNIRPIIITDDLAKAEAEYDKEMTKKRFDL